MSALFLPDYITVGASGGIFGFIGACLADIIMNWKLLFCDFVTENGKKQSHIMVVALLIFDILLNTIIGLTPLVDNFTRKSRRLLHLFCCSMTQWKTHTSLFFLSDLGGMMYGFLCGISTMERLSTDFFGMEEPWTTKAKHFFFRFFGLILSFVVMVITLVFLLHSNGETTPCPGCSWLSCVPFPPWAPADRKWWYCDDCGTVTADIITQPSLHLKLYCPGGPPAIIELTNSTSLSREILQKKLPTYCREFCSSTHQKF